MYKGGIKCPIKGKLEHGVYFLKKARKIEI